MSRRRRLGRLLLLAVVSVLGSAAVALLPPALLPPEPVATMTDPTFDVAAFYQTHPGARFNGEVAFAFTPGLPSQPKPVAGLSQPKPVAGLSQAKTNNAYIIIEVGRQMGLPERAYVIAIATALQETYLRNVANSSVPTSLRLPHEGVESNYDSLGLFQQRPSMGWGTVAQLMDPAQASARFYARLARVSNWRTLSVAGAAQAVQRSAFPDAYAKHTEFAQTIVDAMPSYT
jgi:hypothetical protein